MAKTLRIMDKAAMRQKGWWLFGFVVGLQMLFWLVVIYYRVLDHQILKATVKVVFYVSRVDGIVTLKDEEYIP